MSFSSYILETLFGRVGRYIQANGRGKVRDQRLRLVRPTSRNTRDGLCGTCQMISTPVLGLRPSQVPEATGVGAVQQHIHSSRILPDEERLLGLRNVISADDIPPPFRPRSRLNWPIESATKWKELRISLDDGDVPHDLSLPLPLGSTLEISECGKEMSISQGWRKKPIILPNAPPLADIARLLEDPEKAREIRYWDKFIMALSACVRSLGEGDNLSGGWFKRNGWSGIDTPNAEGALRFEIFGKDPAAFVFLTMLFDDFDPEENYVGSLLRENLDAFMWMGNIGWEWISVFEGEVGQREKMFGTDVHPRLVNFQNKAPHHHTQERGPNANPSTIRFPTPNFASDHSPPSMQHPLSSIPGCIVLDFRLGTGDLGPQRAGHKGR